MSRASHVAAFTAGAVIATAIGAGAIPRDDKAATTARYKTLDSFAQALAYVANNYVDEVDEQKLLHDATRGMVAGLDQHSAFLSAKRYQRLRQDTEGFGTLKALVDYNSGITAGFIKGGVVGSMQGRLAGEKSKGWRTGEIDKLRSVGRLFYEPI